MSVDVRPAKRPRELGMNEKEGDSWLLTEVTFSPTQRGGGRAKGEGGGRPGYLNGAANMRKTGPYNRRLSMGDLSSLANVYAHVSSP